ncbi:hypothetical protein B296_00059189 [Ensete ventricosum]|uniref:Uncharacterized protein n=1 Tax=Ensete ventricosum TaxID=4639 RepID=A0A426WW75_ENSVE|nr:hypothetical protein B296_00059189 [Ensete ventricosum]
MDLGELRGMPKVISGKVPPTRPTAREVDPSPAREASRASSKRPVVSPPEQAEDAVRHHKKVKVLTRRHKSHLGEGESRSRSKVHDAGRLITFMDYRVKQLQEELDALKSKGGPEAVAEAEERASELREELEKTKRERDEELLRREASEKEL